MVDLPTCKTAMRTKSKARKYIEPDAFHLARRRAGLTMMQAADLLEVDIRTVCNWENESCKIPYAAFLLMHMAAGYALQGKAWEGWALWDGKLYTPSGRSFQAHELEYVGTYISLARHFLKTRETSIPNPAALPSASLSSQARPTHALDRQLSVTIESGKASDATASAGASPCHEAVVIEVDFGQQSKSTSSLEDSFKFGRFKTAAAAANEALYG